MENEATKNSAVNDMTTGKPLTLLLRFSMPVLLSNVLMVLYTFADSAIVGRILGVEAFAAIGATGMLGFMVFSIALGLGQGFGIVYAQRFGAKDMDGLRSSFVTGIYLVAIFGAVVGAAGIAWSGLFLKLLNTPQELMGGAVTYLTWTLGGMTVTFVNIFAGGVLRALGNSKTPMYAMIVSSVANIALNLLFVGPFGIAGIAVATLLAQLISSVYCFIVLGKSGVMDGCGCKWHTPSALKLLRMGLPLAFRNAVIQGGGVVIQWFVNGYNDIALIAGISIAKRLYSLVLVAGGALDAANATFVAQNFGAGLIERMKKGLVTARWLMLASAAVIMAALLPLARVLIGLLFTGDPATVAATLDYGALQLRIILCGLPLLHLLFLYRSALEGVGKPLVPVLSGFLELIFRIGSILVLTPFFVTMATPMNAMGVLISDAAGWIGATILLAISYHVVMKKLKAA